MAEAWDVTQASVSQIEQTPDIYLSTLRNYVAALGGAWRSTPSSPTRRSASSQASSWIVGAPSRSTNRLLLVALKP
jgi:hypothetical protein